MKLLPIAAALATGLRSSLTGRIGLRYPDIGPPAVGPARATLPLVHVDDQAAVKKLPSYRVTFKNLGFWRAVTQLPLRAADPLAVPDETLRVGETGPVVYVYRPDTVAENPPGILYIHGGGMVLGRAQDNHEEARRICDLSGAVVVNVTYRLAPEHPFPAPLNDCNDALCWMRDQAGMLGIDPDRISVLGFSAGGGLCCGVVHRARDQGGPKVRAYFPVYPMIDPRTGTTLAPEDDPKTGEFVWTRTANRTGWQAYRGHYAMEDERMGWFAPALDSNFADLPPCYLPTCDLDLFAPENRAYAKAVRDAGGQVEYVEYEGTVHGFDSLLPRSPVTARFFEDLKAAFDRLL